MRGPVVAPVLLCAAFAACSCSNVPPSGAGGSARPGVAGSRGGGGGGKGKSEELARVANSDPSGADNQPDWNDLARQTKEMVGPRLPDPLPTDTKAACAEMLDAALTFYASVEPNPEHQKARRDELLATREADQAACESRTSVAAAKCVTILLGDKNAEFPWLLDQCMRAYP